MNLDRFLPYSPTYDPPFQRADANLVAVHLIDHLLNAPNLLPLVNLEEEQVFHAPEHLSSWHTSRNRVFLPQFPQTTPDNGRNRHDHVQLDRFCEDAPQTCFIRITRCMNS